MAILNVARPLGRWWSYRQACRTLSSLDHRTLDDLGINPDEIRAVARRAAR